MAEIDFERRLERMFGEAPAFNDNAAFAARVEKRLDRGWATRRVLIWVAGVSGGVVGASQLLVSNLRPSLSSVDLAPALQLTRLDEAGKAMSWLSPLAGGETMWLIAALALTAVAFGVTRLIEEF